MAKLISHSQHTYLQQSEMVPPAQLPSLQRAAPPGNVAKRAVRNLGDMVGEEVAMTVQASCVSAGYGPEKMDTIYVTYITY